MNNFKLGLFLLVLFFGLIAHAYDEVLYWMIDDTSVVHYQDGSTVFMPMMVPESADSSLAARVRVSGGNLTEDTFLDLYYTDGENTYRWPGNMGLDFGDNGSGYWGCGVPTGNQSPITDFTSPEFMFMIEIGNYSYDESSDTENWTTVASSASQSYTSLIGYTYQTFDINPPTSGIWNPHDYYAVPEPSTRMFMLIGFMFLMLQRKRVR